MKLNFDMKGHLIPYERIKLNIKEFENFFIDQFDSESSRGIIFESYLRFVNDFQSEITPQFTQWIDGSFVTQKSNPRDIDFVTLIKHDTYKHKRHQIDSKFKLRKAK